MQTIEEEAKALDIILYIPEQQNSIRELLQLIYTVSKALDTKLTQKVSSFPL